MEIQVLPVGPAPKHLTARASTPSLSQHLLAFRALYGFEDDPEEDDGSFTFFKFLHEMVQLEHLTIREMKAKAKELREALGRERLGQVMALNLISRLLGYADYMSLLWLARIEGGWRKGTPFPSREQDDKTIVHSCLTEEGFAQVLIDLRAQVPQLSGYDKRQELKRQRKEALGLT